MKIPSLKILPAIFLPLCLIAMPVSPRAGEVSPKDETALRKEMEEARRELADAARHVAELSRELGESFDFHRHAPLAPHAPRRAMLGITVGEENDAGVEVLSVTPGGPADRAGLQAGDVIVAIRDVNLLDADMPSRTLIETLAEVEPGTEVTLKYRRGDDQRSTEVVAEAFQPRFRLFGGGGFDFEFPEVPHPPVFLELMRGWGDMELAALSPQLGAYFGTDKGLLVVRAPEDEAYRLRDGDVILAIGGREPEDPAHAMRILRSYRGGEKFTLDILRERKKMSLEIEVPERRIGLLDAPLMKREEIVIARPPEVVTEGT